MDRATQPQHFGGGRIAKRLMLTLLAGIYDERRVAPHWAGSGLPVSHAIEAASVT